MSDQAETAWAPHDCKAWNYEHWRNQSECVMTYCGICDKTTHFKWKSFIRHFKEYFR